MAKDSLLSFTKDVEDRTVFLRYHLSDSTKKMGKRNLALNSQIWRWIRWSRKFIWINQRQQLEVLEDQTHTAKVILT